jgi:hypothetical protein
MIHTILMTWLLSGPVVFLVMLPAIILDRIKPRMGR